MRIRNKGIYKKWSAADREWLKELASVHNSDFVIAEIMERNPTAVAFQRRQMRIRLCGTYAGAPRRSAMDGYKPVAFEESIYHVEKLLSLAAVATPRLSILETLGYSASPAPDYGMSPETRTE